MPSMRSAETENTNNLLLSVKQAILIDELDIYFDETLYLTPC